MRYFLTMIWLAVPTSSPIAGRAAYRRAMEKGGPGMALLLT
jgi:hypothetical protein